MEAILSTITISRFEDDVSWVATVFGGDLNTVKDGENESTYHVARRWSSGLAAEDRRITHLLGRLDYLFFRTTEGVSGAATRLNDKFGSDHYPVLGRLSATGVTGQQSGQP